MSKKSKILVGLFAFALFVTGCGPKTPEEALKNAIEKTDKVESAKVEGTITAEVKSGSVSASVSGNVGLEVKSISEKEGIAHLTSSFEANGEQFKIEAYGEIKDKKITGYFGIDDEWLKTTDEMEEETFDADLKFKEVKKVSSEDGITVYEAIIDNQLIKDEVKKLVEENKVEGMEEIDLSGFNYDFEDIAIQFSVNKKNLITKITSEIPVNFNINVQEESNQFTVTLKLDINFSKYGEVEDIKVPQEVLDKAIDEEELEIRTYIESYANEIEWDVWENEEKDNAQYTDTTLEYDGPAPTKVDVLVQDSEIISGVIEINGYTATFENSEIVSFKKN